MNLHHHKWLDLEVTNNYFSNGVCPHFEIIPFSDTSLQMKNYEILMKKGSNIISFYAGVGVEESFTMDQNFKGLDNLYFQLINNDPLFFNYSDISAKSEQELYLFQNTSKSEESNQLQANKYVSDQDLIGYKPKVFNITLPNKQVNIEIKTVNEESIKQESIDGIKVRNHLLNLSALDNGVYQIWLDGQLHETFFTSSEELSQQCIGVIQFNIKDFVFKNQNALKYTIDFNARSVYWQYEVVVKNVRKIKVKGMKVVGANNEDYNGPEEKQIIGEQTAQVFTTSSPVQMQYKLDVPPQLQVTYSNEFSNRENLLEIKLPNPETEQLKKFNQKENDGSFLSSTIVYV
jgi:hypothetical protein